MKRVAIYPGSFDPVTKGHVDLMRRILRIFDEVIITVANNPRKPGLFSFAERKELIRQSLHEAKIDMARVKIDSLEPGKLIVRYAKKMGAMALIRSFRTVTDYEYERVMAYENRVQEPAIETVPLFPDAKYEMISSSKAREVAELKGKLGHMVYPSVRKALREKFRKK